MTNAAPRTESRTLETNEPPGTQMTTEQLDQVIGCAGNGAVPFLVFTFKLVAVKTISWAHD